MLKRIAITGSSGYLGTKLVEYARREFPGVQILGLDLKPPSTAPTDVFVQADIRSPDVTVALLAFSPDTVIHAAFVFQPMHDDDLMRSINVDGCRNLLSAVAELQPTRCHLVSSATAYGAWPDNAMPIPEDWPVRGRPEFRYSADKAEVEKIVSQFAVEQPSVEVSWTRPAVIVGPNMDNYVRRFIFGMPLLVRLDGCDTPLQFVHEDDVTSAIFTILNRNGRGSFNVGPNDWLTASDIAKATQRRMISLPFWLARYATSLAWWLRLPIHEFPSGFLYFCRYPWVVQSDRLTSELGFCFQYSCRETLDLFLANQTQQKQQKQQTETARQ